MSNNPRSWKGWVVTLAIVTSSCLCNCSCRAAATPEPATNVPLATENAPTAAPENAPVYPPLEHLAYSCSAMDSLTSFQFSLGRLDDKSANFTFDCWNPEQTEQWKGADVSVPLSALADVNAILQHHQMKKYLDRPLYWRGRNMWKSALSHVFTVQDGTTKSFSVRWQDNADGFSADGAGPCSQDLTQYFLELAAQHHEKAPQLPQAHPENLQTNGENPSSGSDKAPANQDGAYAALEAVSLSQSAMNMAECWSFELRQQNDHQASFTYRFYNFNTNEQWQGQNNALPLSALSDANAILMRHRAAEFLTNYRKPQSDPDLVLLDATTVQFSARWHGQSRSLSADTGGASYEDLLQFFRELAQKYH